MTKRAPWGDPIRDTSPEVPPHDRFYRNMFDHGDKTILALKESAYRRGVQQGAHEVLCALEAGVSATTIREYVTRTLADWRLRLGKYRKPRHRIQPMPELTREGNTR